MVSYNYGGIRSGEACVGTAKVNGNSNYMAAAYTYTATGSTYGHVELGRTSSCASGTTVANESPEVTLSTNQWGEIIWGPKSGSATWSSTWWQDNGGGNYTDFGSVCGYY